MFVRLKSGVIINCDRINHIEPRVDETLAGAHYVATCWFYKGVGQRLTDDDLTAIVCAIEKGPGLL